jgi:hypothetical protein
VSAAAVIIRVKSLAAGAGDFGFSNPSLLHLLPAFFDLPVFFETLLKLCSTQASSGRFRGFFTGLRPQAQNG